MKHVGEVWVSPVSKCGDLHLQISTTSITLGAEFRNLTVLGERVDGAAVDIGSSAQTRIERAVQRGDAMNVQVSVRHFSKPDCASGSLLDRDISVPRSGDEADG